MAVAVVGFDIGYQSSYVAVARQGGIETLANEYSDRATITCVSLGECNRSQGFAAKQQQNSNMKNTLTGFTRFLGRKTSDPLVQAEMSNHPYKVVEDVNGRAAFQVNYLKEQVVISSEQATAMMLTKLKEIAETNLGIAVKDCVINVPVYYTDCERRAMLDAAHIAGLNCLKLMNDTTATALGYGIYKKDLPDVEAAPRTVVFVDLGASNLQVTAVSFNAGKMKVLGTSFDHSVGGRDFDRAIYNFMADDFKRRFGVDARTSRKAELRLLSESEKLKKLMSANSTDIPLNIECFMEDRDVSGRMNRDTFEGLVTHLLHRIEVALRDVLTVAQLEPAAVYAVELVGGATRVPAVKRLVQTVFGKEPRSTLNADEAVARGCALQCAILSPVYRVRDFAITDAQPYSVTLEWQEQERRDSAEIFPRQHAVPFSRMMTFMRSEPFELHAFYTSAEQVPHSRTELGVFRVTNVRPTAEGEHSKIKVKARINQHGIFTVCQAQLAEKYEVVVPVEEPMDTSDAKSKESKDAKSPTSPPAPAEDAEMKAEPPTVNGHSKEEEPMEVEPAAASGAAATAADTDQPRKKTKVRYHDLPIEASVCQLDKTTLMEFTEREAKMIAQDRLERERSNAKNAVEEYVYEMRDKLSGALEEFVAEKDRCDFSALLSSTEDWLYDEGEDEVKQVYLDRLTKLRNLGDPIVRRFQEAQERPGAVDAFGRAAQSFVKMVEAFRAGDAKYEHLEREDVDRVARLVEEKRQWLISQSNAQAQLAKHQDPVLTAAAIKAETNAMFAAANPVLTKPKPEPPKPEPPKDSEAANGPVGSDEAAPDAPNGSADGSATEGVSATAEHTADQHNNSAATGAAPDGKPHKPTDSKEDMDLD